MNAREANVFLTKAALLDPRMKRLDPVEQADMASEWAETLSDILLGDALQALRRHYRKSVLAIMPAHLLELVGVADVAPSQYVDVTDQIIAASKARALAAAGVTEAEYEAHEHDVVWLRTKFPTVGAAELGPADENGDPE